MDAAFLLTIIGVGLALLVLGFTSQREEIRDNLRYAAVRGWRALRRPFRRLGSRVSDPGGTSTGDGSRFVRDVTIPDGTRVRVNEKFTKIWEIHNVGDVSWQNRYLERQGTAIGPGRLQSRDRVRIPRTEPGQKVRIRVTLTAPRQPGSCYSEWKMTDEKGSILLPRETPLFVSVDVVE